MKGCIVMNYFNNIKFDNRGLVPAVVQDERTGKVIMLAYMNRESIEKTFETGYACYWSRSRGELWIKGEKSGNLQRVKEVKVDCDRDSILLVVEQIGVACHTGNFSCFFKSLKSDGNLVLDEGAVKDSERDGESCSEKEAIGSTALPEVKDCKSEDNIIGDLLGTIKERKINPVEGSYTNYLFEKGIDKILKKVGEESAEVIIAAKNPSKEELVYEISDLVYHTLVLMAERGVEIGDIKAELAGRKKER